MHEPLTKVARYGKYIEVVKFEKPLIRPHNGHGFSRRKKSESTLKLNRNLWRLKRRIRRYIQALSYTQGTPSFATFTYGDGKGGGRQYDMKEAIQQWRRFTAKMKRAFPDVAFVRVPERHKDDAVHFHAVLFNMPSTLACEFQKRGRFWTHACQKTRPCERKLRVLAKLWGHGFVDLQQVRKPESIGAYVSSYLTKGKPDWSLFGNHIASANGVWYQKISAARKAGSLYEASSYSSPTMVRHVLYTLGGKTMEDEYLGFTSTIIRKTREFDTLWLGHARFEVHEILDT